MIEQIVLEHLSGLTVPVYMESPEELPESYVIVEKTGGSIENHVCSSVFAVQSIAGSLYDAAVLNEAVIDRMKSLVINESVSKVSLNSNYNFTNTETYQYRYQAVFDLIHF